MKPEQLTSAHAGYFQYMELKVKLPYKRKLVSLIGVYNEDIRIDRTKPISTALKVYALRTDDEGNGDIVSLEKDVLVNFFGEFLMLKEDAEKYNLDAILDKNGLIPVKDYNFGTINNSIEMLINRLILLSDK